MTTPRRNDPTNAARQAAWRRRQAQAQAQALAAKGLPPLPPIANLPGTARWSAQRKLALATLESMRDEMQDYFDDRTEAWKESERGQAMVQRIETLAALIDAVEELEIA